VSSSYMNSSFAPRMDPHEMLIHHWTLGDTRKMLLTQTIQIRITNQTKPANWIFFVSYCTLMITQLSSAGNKMHVNTATMWQSHKYNSLTCIYCHFTCPPITSSTIPTHTVKPPYYDFEEKRKKERGKIQYSGLISTTFLKWKSLKLCHYCAIKHGNWYSLYHIIPQQIWIILHYIPKLILGSNFHHIPVLNKPTYLSIHDERTKLNGVQNLLACVISLVDKCLANSIWMVTQHSMKAAYGWLTLKSDWEHK
jgi:hypothetical protein